MNQSSKMLVRVARRDVAMLRFLLEGYENLAIATTLERHTSLLKLSYAGQSEQDVIAMLEDINRTIPLQWQKWPFSSGKMHGK